MNSFEGINIEDIPNCGTNDFGSGLRTKLYYAHRSFFKEINLPSSGDYQDRLLISQNDIIFQPNCSWSSIDILIDENELKNVATGSVGRFKAKTDLSIFILGFRSKLMGFWEKYGNEQFVFCISGIDGISFLIGNLRNSARFTKWEATSGIKYEDNSGVSAVISCNSPVYFFKENLIIPEKIGGGFSFIDITEDF